MYGYKKDFRVDSTQICVDSHLYQIICTSAYFLCNFYSLDFRIRGSRAHSSLLKPLEKHPWFVAQSILGKWQSIICVVESHSCRVLYLAFSPIFPWSSWKYNEFVASSNWMSLSYNDSSWDDGAENSFLPFLHERYYRKVVVLEPSVLSTYASFECFICHLFSVEVFINGIHFLTHEVSSNHANTSIETVKREDLHRYFRSSSNVVAIHVYCDLNQALCNNITSDPFTAHFVFFSFDAPTSNNMKLRSVHDKDFYAHPLVNAFDDSRGSEWWFRGRTADVFIEYTNPLYE